MSPVTRIPREPSNPRFLSGRGLVAAVLGLVLLAGLASACGSEPARPPNVILIVMDTTRADRTSLQGHRRPTTPYLETLAAESTVFHEAWSPSSWTGPSHASLFTGLRPENHGLLTGVRLYLDRGADTLAEALARSGYQTACFTGNPTVSADFGLAQGFAEYQFVPAVPGQPSLESQRLTSLALEFVRRARSDPDARPYFLYVNHFLPHLPYDPPSAAASHFLPPDARPEEVLAARRFAPGGRDMVTMVQRDFTERQWSILSALYDAEVATVDQEIQRLVEILRAEEALEDTVLVIVGDHGENLGDHGLCAHVWSLHRTLLRVPLMIRYPRAFRGGVRETKVVRLEDLHPTLLSLCGAPVPEGIDGRSLRELEPGKGRIARAVLGGTLDAAVERDFPDFARSQIWQPRRSAFDGRYHLIRRADGFEELYDLVVDPGERHNLAPSRPALLRQMRELLSEH